jgi:hypothetical protein
MYSGTPLAVVPAGRRPPLVPTNLERDRVVRVRIRIEQPSVRGVRIDHERAQRVGRSSRLPRCPVAFGELRCMRVSYQPYKRGVRVPSG